MKIREIKFGLIVFVTILFAFPAQAQLHVLNDASVAVGTTSSGSAKMRIYHNNEAYSLRLDNYNAANSTKYGLRNYVHRDGTGTKYGIYNLTYQSASSSNQLRGIYNYTYNYGGSGTSYGIYTYASGSSSASGTRYGIYSSMSTSGTGTKYAGYFVGDVYVSGTLINLVSNTPAPTTNQKQVQNALGKLSDVTTTATLSEANKSSDNPRTTYGFDVSSLKESFPDLVYEIDRSGEVVPVETTEELAQEGDAKFITPNNDNVSAVNYNGLIPVLVQAIKDQQTIIDEQKQRIDRLEEKIDGKH